MSKSITIRYQDTDDGTVRQSYQLIIQATAASEMPREVFVFQRGAAAPAGQPIVDQFVCIADPVDLEEVPVAVPDVANEQPYYRLAEVTLSFRSVPELLATKADIASDLSELVSALNSQPTNDTTVQYG